MAVKWLAVIVFATLLLVGGTQLRSNQAKRDALQRGRVAVAIENAKAAGKQEVNLPAPIPLYAAVIDLNHAVANYTTVIAQPSAQHSQIGLDSKEVETWYKFSVIDFLSEPTQPNCKTCSVAHNIPQELQPVEPNEIVILRLAGSVISDGVKVNSKDSTFPDFTTGQKYLLFVSLDPSTRFGTIELGASGVLTIESNGEISPVYQRAGKLHRELSVRYGGIDNIKNQLRFRRFPQ